MTKALKSRLNSLTKGTSVEVYWEDITVEVGWQEGSKVPTTGTCRTVAIFDRIETDHLVMYGTEGTTDRETNNRIFIPVGTVTRVNVLEIK